MKCPNCKGTGTIALFTSTKPCDKCAGSGHSLSSLVIVSVADIMKMNDEKKASLLGVLKGSIFQKYAQELMLVTLDDLKRIAAARNEPWEKVLAAKDWLDALGEKYANP